VHEHARLGQVTHHGHVALFAFVGVFRTVFLGHDLTSINVQCVLAAIHLAQGLCHYTTTHLAQTGQANTRAHTPQPVTERVSAGGVFNFEQMAQALIGIDDS